MSFLTLSAGMALSFGALHALEPGHGKTAIITYVASEKRGWKDGVVLSISSALTHSIVVFLVAFISHYFFHHFSVENNVANIHSTLSMASGFIIGCIGVWFMMTSGKSSKPNSSCSCSVHKSEKSSLYTSSFMGVAAGLIPCPTILIAYLAGVSSGNSLGGIENVFLFALGMCLSLLCLVMVSSVFGEKITRKFKGKAKKLNWRFCQGFLFMIVGLFTATYH